MERRNFLKTASAGLAAAGLATTWLARPGTAAAATATAPLAELETRVGGRLGAYVLDTGSGRGFGHRETERFAHCSSFKLSLAALVLREAAAGRLALDERLDFTEDDLLGHAPDTRAMVERGSMSVFALARAAQVSSDNTAANLLLRRLGGPRALTAFWRSLGDPSSRLDNIEPVLNDVAPGAVHDTARPRDMARTVARILFGEVLPEDARGTLLGWMRATTTGLDRLRGGMPLHWDTGDKTGTFWTDEAPGTCVDIAFAVPPGPDGDGNGAPLVITAYYNPPAPMSAGDPEAAAVLAEIGSIATAWALA